MQTSFMHPPFGFALFYLRSVAPVADYIDKVTGKLIPKITTGQIYWGAVPFVCIQIIMVGLVIAFPEMVTSMLDRGPVLNESEVQMQLQIESPNYGGDPAAESETPGEEPEAGETEEDTPDFGEQEEDPNAPK